MSARVFPRFDLCFSYWLYSEQWGTTCFWLKLFGSWVSVKRLQRWNGRKICLYQKIWNNFEIARSFRFFSFFFFWIFLSRSFSCHHIVHFSSHYIAIFKEKEQFCWFHSKPFHVPFPFFHFINTGPTGYSFVFRRVVVVLPKPIHLSIWSRVGSRGSWADELFACCLGLCGKLANELTNYLSLA